MASERVRIPRLTSRSGLLWVGGTLVVLVGAMAYVAVTQPQFTAGAVAVALVAVLLAVAVSTRRQWLEPERGRLGVEWLGGLRRSVDLADARTVKLVDNRGGGLMLAVAPASGRTMQVPVLLLSDYVQASQEPAVLRLLADQIDTFSPAAASVAGRLRRQADYGETGGPPAESPLAGLVSHTVIRAAKGGGAAGGTSLLD